MVRIERHELGPRLHLLGRLIHEYHVGFAVLASTQAVSVARSEYFSLWTALVTLAGLWLVVKDWPDLFPATRNTASWSLGIHRLPCKANVLRPAQRTGLVGRQQDRLARALRSCVCDPRAVDGCGR